MGGEGGGEGRGGHNISYTVAASFKTAEHKINTVHTMPSDGEMDNRVFVGELSCKLCVYNHML